MSDWPRLITIWAVTGLACGTVTLLALGLIRAAARLAAI